MSYNFDGSVNEVGNLASGIYKYDFDEDNQVVNQSYISGWLQNNMGELNILIHTCYSGAYPGMGDEEQSIYRQVFLKEYYAKLGRKVLMGVSSYESTNPGGDSSMEWTEIREGDTVIRRQAVTASPSVKVNTAREYVSASKASDLELKDLVYKYNVNQGGPRQVAGNDAA